MLLALAPTTANIPTAIFYPLNLVWNESLMVGHESGGRKIDISSANLSMPLQNGFYLKIWADLTLSVVALRCIKFGIPSF